MDKVEQKEVFSKNLRKQLAMKGKTQADLVNDLKISSSTVSDWANAKKYPRMDKVQMIADYLGIYKSALIEEQQTIEYNNISSISTQKIPLLGTVACGKPIYADENFQAYIEAGHEIQADFCLRCQGDSMVNARIHDGDIVFIKKQDMVNNGEIAVVIIEDEATLKRFYYYEDKSLVILKAENPKYEDIIIAGEGINNIKILGKAIAFQSEIRS